MMTTSRRKRSETEADFRRMSPCGTADRRSASELVRHVHAHMPPPRPPRISGGQERRPTMNTDTPGYYRRPACTSFHATGVKMLVHALESPSQPHKEACLVEEEACEACEMNQDLKL